MILLVGGMSTLTWDTDVTVLMMVVASASVVAIDATGDTEPARNSSSLDDGSKPKTMLKHRVQSKTNKILF